MITMVAGPHCAGKTTFVRAHMHPDDSVLDWDDLYCQITGLERYDWEPDLVALTERAFRRGEAAFRTGWVIRTAPSRKQRAIFRKSHEGGRSIVLAVPVEECLRRLASRPEHVRESQRPIILRWWEEYEPSSSADETTYSWQDGQLALT